MVKVKYDKETRSWITLESNSKEGIYLDGKLKDKLDKIKQIQKQNWDAIILVDGLEGSGKSTLGMTISYYLADTNFGLKNFSKSSDEAREKLESLPDGSLLMIDEAALVFSSRESSRREQVNLVKLLTVIRQKRMILVIVSPSFFDLNKYISVHRSRFLLHVYTSKTLQRGRFCYFGEKRKHMLYVIGKKNFNSYAKPKANFFGVFTDFNPFGDDYLQLKKETLETAFDDVRRKSEGELKIEMRREIVAKNEELGRPVTQKVLSKLLGVTIRTIQQDITKITKERGGVTRNDTT